MIKNKKERRAFILFSFIIIAFNTNIMHKKEEVIYFVCFNKLFLFGSAAMENVKWNIRWSKTWNEQERWPGNDLSIKERPVFLSVI